MRNQPENRVVILQTANRNRVVSGL